MSEKKHRMVRIAGKNCRKNTQKCGGEYLMEFGAVTLAVPVIQMNFGNNPFRTP
jgi:hypothetical protein